MQKLFIVDAYNLIYRAYFAMAAQNRLQTSDGKTTFTAYLFVRYLKEIIHQWKATHLIIALDSKGKSIRHEKFPAYKANRSAAPAELRDHLDEVIKMLGVLNVNMVRIDATEADDIIGTLTRLAKEQGIESWMVSSDKDLAQLVDDKCRLLRPSSQGFSELGKKEVFEKFLCHPHQIVDYLSMLGDTSDNIPGIKGIGEKGAAALLEKYQNLENIYLNIHLEKPAVVKKFTEQKEMAMLSKELVTIDQYLPIILEIEKTKIESNIFYAPDIQKYFKDNEFNSYLAK